MPRLKDIDQFKKDLASLARESEVLERWGEVREDPPVPDGAVAEPVRGEIKTVQPKAKAKPKDEADEGLPPDFATLLADLPLDADAALDELGSAPSPGAPDSYSTDDLDLESLLGGDDLGAPPSAEGELDDLGMGLVDEAPRASGFEGLEGGATQGLVDDLGLPEDLGFADASLSEEPLPEEAVPTEGFAEEPPPGEASPEAPAEDFGGFDDLPSLDGFEEAPPAEPQPEPSDTPESPIDEFAMPDFGDFGAEAPTTEAPAEAAPEEAGPEAAAPEGFSVPDLDDFGSSPGLDESFAEVSAAEESAADTPAPEAPAAEAGFGDFSMDDFAIPEVASSPAPGPADQGGGLDSFSLDGAGFDSGSFGGLGGVDLDSQLEALGDEVAPSGTFNLDKDWGAGFEVPGEPEEKPAPKKAPKERPQSVASEEAKPVSLTEAQVDRLQDRLLSFPLNLRLAVEDAIANEKGTEAQRSKLVWYLVERKPFDDVANLVSKIQKRRITVPTGYEKSTGADFQAEQGSLGYLFVHTILPILKVAVLVMAAAGVLGYLGWRFVYKPLAADALYRQGYTRITQDRYAEAEAAFAKAGAIKEYVSWYYRYAEAYAEKRQYLLAEKKYSDLLGRHPTEYKAAMDWAALERRQLKYREGVDILQKRILEKKYLDKDALLLQGDIYLDWADEDPAHYADARRSYATLIQYYGMEDLYLERMLLYFMRTDQLKEVLPLKKHFLAGDKLFPSASTLAELGGYLFDKKSLEDVHTILLAAQAKDKLLPEAHYHLARYFEASNSPGEERKALGNALTTFGKLSMITPRREAMFIDSYIRRARLEFQAREYIAAETDYSAAAAEYAKAQDLGRIHKAPRFAEAYAGLGEVAYWQRDDLSAALAYFERAAAEGWDSPELRYERGYIHYRQGNPKAAVEQFYLAGLGKTGTESPYLLYGFGNALYARGNWSAAEAYYRRTINAMEGQLEQINLPVPSEKASHAEIMELLMEARNNLGAALLKSATRTGDARKRAEAVQAFTESTRLYDSLGRDQAPLKRSGKENLGLANLNLLMEARRAKDPAIYTELERGMDFPSR